MIRLEKFDGTKTYMFPNGEVATPERIRADFPAVDMFAHILEINGDVCQGVMNLNAMRNIHTVDDGLNEGEAILAIEQEINYPTVIPQEPSPEERMASAMEFQNILAL